MFCVRRMLKYMANMLIQYDLGTSGPINEVIISFHRWTPKDFTLHCNAISTPVLPNDSRQAAVRDLPPMDKKPGFTRKSALSLKRKYIF